MYSLVFLDTETTGLDNQSCDLLELSAIRIKDGKKAGKFDSLIRPFSDVPKEIEKLTGITNEEAQQAPEIEKVREKFLKKFIQPEDIIVAHNAQFDIDFLNAKEFNLKNPFIDSFEIAQIVCSEEKSLSLEALAINFDIQHKNAHRALADVEATIGIWKKMSEIVLINWSEDLLISLKEILQKSTWTGKIFFDECFKNLKNKSKNPQASLFDMPKTTLTREEIKSPTEKEIEISNQISEKYEKCNKLMIEIEPPSREIISVLLAVKNIVEKTPQEKIGIVCDIKNKNFILNALSDLNINSIKTAFFDLPKYFLCNEKLENFLLKPIYSDTETKMLVKIIKSISLNNHYHLSDFRLNFEEATSYFLYLSNDDYAKCLSNCTLKKQIQKFADAQIILLPHRALDIFDGNSLFFLEADNLESDLNNLSKTYANMKTFERLSEKYNSQKYSKFFDGLFFGFGFLAKYLKDKIGEIIYPEHLTISTKEEQSQEFQNFADFFLEAKKELLDFFPNEKFVIDEIVKWHDFFNLERQTNELKYLTIYPDDSLACEKLPIDLTDFFEKYTLNKKHLILTSNNFIKTINEPGKITKPTYSFKTENFDFYKFKSDFNFDKCLFIVPKELGNNEKNNETLSSQIVNFAENVPKNLCYISASKNIAKKIEDILIEEISDKAIVMSHLGGNIAKTHCKVANINKKIILLMTYNSAISFDFENCDFGIFMLQKFIFDPPGNPINEARKNLYQNEFFEYALPKAIYKFLNILYKATYTNKKFVFISLDQKIMHSNSWGNHLFTALPEELPKKFLDNDKAVICLKEFFT